MLLQKWSDKTRFKPTLFQFFLPLNAPDCEKVPFATLFWSTYVTRHNKTGQFSVTKKNVMFLLSERTFY